jgi:hypothetical protein
MSKSIAENYFSQPNTKDKEAFVTKIKKAEERRQ